MTVSELITKLTSFNKPDAVVTVSLGPNEEDEKFELKVNGTYLADEGFVDDARDISDETENGNTLCIFARRP